MRNLTCHLIPSSQWLKEPGPLISPIFSMREQRFERPSHIARSHSCGVDPRCEPRSCRHHSCDRTSPMHGTASLCLSLWGLCVYTHTSCLLNSGVTHQNPRVDIKIILNWRHLIVNRYRKKRAQRLPCLTQGRNPWEMKTTINPLYSQDRNGE